MYSLLFIILMCIPFSFQTVYDDKSVCDSDNKEYMGIEVYVEATLDEPSDKQRVNPKSINMAHLYQTED